MFLAFSDPFSRSLVAVLCSGVLALLTAAIFRILIQIQSTGTEKMKSIANEIRKGSTTFLRREYMHIFLFSFCIAFGIFLFLDTGFTNAQQNNWGIPYISGSFLIGVFCSTFAGSLGMRSATAGNIRTTQAARTSLGNALRVAFLSGCSAGLFAVGMALVGLVGGLLFLIHFADLSLGSALQTLIGFSFGASVVALFARIGGGVFTKAADIGADLVGKIEAGIAEDDPRNPAAIADNVGDNVGDVAGMGADLFESYVGSLLAAMLIGLMSQWDNPEIAVLFPLYIAAMGIVAAIIGTFVIRTKKGSSDVHGALKNGLFLSSVILIAGTFFLAHSLLPEYAWFGVFVAMTSGVIVGLILGIITEYYTSDHYGPVRNLAHATRTGTATTLISGLALGYVSSILPVLFIAGTIGLAFFHAGLYGIAIASVGMLSTLGLSLAIDAYGPVADNAGGIAAMAKLPKQVRTRLAVLDSAGNTTAAIGKGFAIGSAMLAALALFSVFIETANVHSINLTNPFTFIGLLIGGALPFVFSGMILHAVSRGALLMIEEVRRQFREIKGLMDGKESPDSAACVAIATRNALRSMTIPSIVAVCTPIVVGYILGAEALGGLLAGSLISGFVLAISMANSGGAWDNAKKYIEAGNLGGEGSSAHKVAIIADNVGDPLKDASGPSINILIKIMTIVSLLTVGLYSAGGLVG